MTDKSSSYDSLHHSHHHFSKKRIIYHLQTVSINQHNNRNDRIFNNASAIKNSPLIINNSQLLKPLSN